MRPRAESPGQSFSYAPTRSAHSVVQTTEGANTRQHSDFSVSPDDRRGLPPPITRSPKTREYAMNRVSKALTAAVTAVCAAALLAVGAPPAAASTTLAACTGNETVTFSPPLTNTLRPTTLTVTGNVSCTQLLPPATYTGTYGGTFQRDYSCLTLLNGGPGSRTITWSDHKTSTFTFQSQNNAVNGQFVALRTGSISGQRFNGAGAVEEGTGLADLTACTTQGLSQVNTLTVLTLTP